MATFLGAIEILNSLGFYAYIFPFILIFAMSYGILVNFKPFGADTRVNLIIAMIIGFLFISFSKAVDFMNMLTPLIIISLIIMLLIIMAFKFGGVTDATISDVLKHPAGYGLLIGVFILIISMTVTYTQPQLLENLQPINQSELSPEGFALTPHAKMQQTVQTLFHPTIMALVIMFMMFAIAVYMVTHKSG